MFLFCSSVGSYCVNKALKQTLIFSLFVSSELFVWKRLCLYWNCGKSNHILWFASYMLFCCLNTTLMLVHHGASGLASWMFISVTGALFRIPLGCSQISIRMFFSIPLNGLWILFFFFFQFVWRVRAFCSSFSIINSNSYFCFNCVFELLAVFLRGFTFLKSSKYCKCFLIVFFSAFAFSKSALCSHVFSHFQSPVWTLMCFHIF